jgi:hypothetical protein
LDIPSTSWDLGLKGGNKMLWLQKHIAIVCIAVGAFLTLFVMLSWAIGYYANGLYGMHFQIESCWTGLNAIAISLVGFFKWVIDSWKNSDGGFLPFGYQKGGVQNESSNPSTNSSDGRSGQE